VALCGVQLPATRHADIPPLNQSAEQDLQPAVTHTSEAVVREGEQTRSRPPATSFSPGVQLYLYTYRVQRLKGDEVCSGQQTGMMPLHAERLKYGICIKDSVTRGG